MLHLSFTVVAAAVLLCYVNFYQYTRNKYWNKIIIKMKQKDIKNKTKQYYGGKKIQK